MEFLKYATKHIGLGRMHLEKYMAAGIPGIYNFTPAVIEERQLNVAQMDVFSRLMMDRIIFLGRPVDDYVANVIQAQLLFLDSTDPKRDIQMYINSPGGSVTAGLGIFDTMNYIHADVATICTSMAASMAANLLASGQKGKRTCLPHSRVMIHQPSGGMQGQVTEMEIAYRLIKDLQRELNEILAKNTGQPIEKILADSDRDNWMTALEAKFYGIVDEVLTS
ncbi:MAG: ATP-dependent Clp protease proteolytic subunit [Lewinellaceae bacterium]|nr:ATP-dependent Clp protease proteolytic subunit [Lewinellaceae bacterium]